jgi:hypothetical protein
MVILGGLEELLEFSSITFIIVSLLMAHANFVKRKETGTHPVLAVGTMALLAMGMFAILRYQWLFHTKALSVTLVIYATLGIGAASYARRRNPAT